MRQLIIWLIVAAIVAEIILFVAAIFDKEDRVGKKIMIIQLAILGVGVVAAIVYRLL